MALIAEATLAAEVESARARGLDRDAQQVIAWAHGLLGEQLMMTTAFGKSGMVILHMVRDLAPGLPVYFLDTSFHFPETLDFGEQLRRDWGVNLIFARPRLYGDAFKQVYGEKPYESNPDLCCHQNKVEPQRQILERYQGWIAGVRKDQASTRAGAEALEILEGAKLKVQPLAHWGRTQVDAYIREHAIRLHPLFEKGYSSIGCAPCTQPSSDPTNERAGRWAGKGKTECGLHTFWKKAGGGGAAGERLAAGGAEPAPATGAAPASGSAPGSTSASGPAAEPGTGAGMVMGTGPVPFAPLSAVG